MIITERTRLEKAKKLIEQCLEPEMLKPVNIENRKERIGEAMASLLTVYEDISGEEIRGIRFGPGGLSINRIMVG